MSKGTWASPLFTGRVGSGLVMGTFIFFVAQAGSGQVSLVWVWKISLKNPKFFYFFPFGFQKISSVMSKGTRVKYGLTPYFLREKVCSGQGPSPVDFLKSLTFTLFKPKHFIFKPHVKVRQKKKSPLYRFPPKTFFFFFSTPIETNFSSTDSLSR